MRTNTVTHRRSIVRDKATWAVYGLLTVYTFFLALIGPLLPHLRAELGLSYAAGALRTSAFAAGVIVSGLLGEVIIERFGRRRAVQFALAGLGVDFQLVALAPSAAMSISGSAMMGLVGTHILVVVPAVLAERHGQARAFLHRGDHPVLSRRARRPARGVVCRQHGELADYCCSSLGRALHHGAAGARRARRPGWH
jgi:cyanate permease